MNKKVKMMCETAIMVALAVLLDLLFKAIPFMEMPTGGSFSLAMMPVILNGYRNGAKWGVISGICYAVINFMIDGFWWHWGSIFFDYLIAFGVLGLSGLFKNKASKQIGWYIGGIVIVCFLRYISHSLGGVMFFAEYAEDWFVNNPNSFAAGSVFLYSFVIYNGPYMLLSSIGVVLVSLGLRKFIYPASCKK